MQKPIRLLSEETINQIAAGEVVESPASVVKELIENALDANSTKVSVEITGGGLKSIRVIDDGVGMNAEDARLSILRHATSKIVHPEDLFHLLTKGFRGEALASIASISKMTVTTARENEVGIKLEVEKGKIVKKRSCARVAGTTIEVRSLFYNVPARKKFQKTAAAISAEIFRIVTVMSLSHPEVQFELISNGRKAIKAFASEDVQERAKVLLGEEFVAGSFPLIFKEEGFVFSGFIGAPTNTRNNKMHQFLYLNRRAVICPEISDAVREGYGTRLDEKRHPIFLLHLDIPHDLIDVNVHPQKLYVRLRDEVLLKEKMQKAVEKALAIRGEKKQGPLPEYRFDEVKVNYVMPVFREAETGIDQELSFDQEFIEVMGVVGKYLFLHEEEGVTIVDLHAARARIVFENLLNKEGREIERQGLLVPLVFELTPIETAMVLTHQDAIEGIGFSLSLANEKEFKVDAIPPFVDEGEVKSMLCEMANQLQEYIGKGDYKKQREKKVAQIACRFAKAKKVYTKEEGKKLYEQLGSCASPLHCPKGDPTKVKLNHDRLKLLFAENQEASKCSSC